MPGFGPVADGPVADTGGPVTGSGLRVSEQHGYAAMTFTGLAVSEQHGYVAMATTGLFVSEQHAYVVMVPTPAPVDTRRRQVMHGSF